MRPRQRQEKQCGMGPAGIEPLQALYLLCNLQHGAVPQLTLPLSLASPASVGRGAKFVSSRDVQTTVSIEPISELSCSSPAYLWIAYITRYLSCQPGSRQLRTEPCCCFYSSIHENGISLMVVTHFNFIIHSLSILLSISIK